MSHYSDMYYMCSIEETSSPQCKLTIKDLDNREVKQFHFPTFEAALSHYRLLFEKEMI